MELKRVIIRDSTRIKAAGVDIDGIIIVKEQGSLRNTKTYFANREIKQIKQPWTTIHSYLDVPVWQDTDNEWIEYIDKGGGRID